MNRWWLAAALLAVVGPVNAADLSLNRIMLSTGGVGYFEYEAVVDGNATLSLDVPLDQVDDILKSLVVYDDNGTAGEVTLPGREPLTQALCRSPLRPSSTRLGARSPQCPAGCRGAGDRRKADERTPVARGRGDCARR
jgi:hypothetical protein